MSSARPSTSSLVSAQDLRSVLAHIPTPVAAIGAMTQDGPLSFIASTFVGISLEPPIVSLSFQQSSERWKRLQTCASVGVTILARHHGHRTRRLASSSTDPYHGVDVRSGDNGEIYIADGVVAFSCHIDVVVPAGDHDIALLVVDEIVTCASVEPLVFHDSQFRRLAPDHMSDGDWLTASDWH